MNSNEEENIFEDSIKHKWSFEQEDILAEWSDKAKCYKWLHGKSHDKYYFYNACFTIPVIIMSIAELLILLKKDLEKNINHW